MIDVRRLSALHERIVTENTAPGESSPYSLHDMVDAVLARSDEQVERILSTLEAMDDETLGEWACGMHTPTDKTQPQGEVHDFLDACCESCH